MQMDGIEPPQPLRAGRLRPISFPIEYICLNCTGQYGMLFIVAPLHPRRVFGKAVVCLPSAGERIRTSGPLQDRNLIPAPLT